MEQRAFHATSNLHLNDSRENRVAGEFAGALLDQRIGTAKDEPVRRFLEAARSQAYYRGQNEQVAVAGVN